MLSISQFQLWPAAPQPPPPSQADPGHSNSQGGDSWAVKSLGVGKKRGQMPCPPSTLQHFSLIAQSSSSILSILMWDFFFQSSSVFSHPRQMSQSACFSSKILCVVIYILIGNFVHVKRSGLVPALANARPPGSVKFANVPPPGLTGCANAPQ